MNQRSIQDIVPPARNKPIRQAPPQPPREPRPEYMKSEPHGSIFLWIALGTIAVVAAVIALMTFFFHSATASVTVLEWKSDVTGPYEAGGENQLPFELVTATERATKTVPATGMVDAEDRATGTIIISNLNATKSQRLITNTRFESPAGLVYRIHAPVTVPGYTMKGGAKVAGTVEAQVYADQPGDKYNLATADFTLPGLKGTDQYTTITAKAKTPIAGGFVGKRATVEKSVRDEAVASLKAELERTLRERVVGGAAAGSIVFPESMKMVYLESPDSGEGSEATIAVEATATAPAFPGDALTRALATRAAISSDAVLELKNPNELSFAFSEGALNGSEPFTFTLSGSAHLRAVFNTTEFATALAGKSESDAESVRAEFQSLAGPLGLTVKPFWLSSLPKNPEHIEVVVKGALDQ